MQKYVKYVQKYIHKHMRPRVNICRREGLSRPRDSIPAHVGGHWVKDPGLLLLLLLLLLLFRGLGPYRLNFSSYPKTKIFMIGVGNRDFGLNFAAFFTELRRGLKHVYKTPQHLKNIFLVVCFYFFSYFCKLCKE